LLSSVAAPPFISRHILIMYIIKHIANVLWLPFVLVLAAALGGRRAAVAALVIGWMFLPQAEYDLPVIDYNKDAAISAGLVLCFIFTLFEPRRNAGRTPFGWDSLFMAIFVLCPFASSMSNGLGEYDGFVATTNRVIQIGIPYLIGRRCVTDAAGARRLAHAFILGALVYIPFCCAEIALGPFWHRTVYGWNQHQVSQQVRFGGYRPMVFMYHGITVAYWMGTAALIAFWLWRTRSTHRLGLLPMGLVVAALGVMTLLCKTLGPIILIGVVAVALVLAVKLQHRALLTALMLLPPVYLLGPLVGLKFSDGVRAVTAEISADRLESYEYRLRNEEEVLNKAQERPVFGWGGWGRAKLHEEGGNTISSVTDSLWIIEFSGRGLVGLVSLYFATLLPSFRFFRVFPVHTWTYQDVAPAVVLAVLPIVFIIDALANNNLGPVILFVIGAVETISLRRQRGLDFADPVPQEPPLVRGFPAAFPFR
jgi:hypothetical protein